MSDPPPPFATPSPLPAEEASSFPAAAPAPPWPPEMPGQLPPPMAPMQYSMPVRGRPGVITAIGVISIVVGSLSFLGNLGTGITLGWFSIMARFAGSAMVSAPLPTTPPPMATTLPAGQATTDSTDGTDPADTSNAAVANADAGPERVSAATEPSAAASVAERGLDADARMTVITVVTQIQYLTESRQSQLDGLLAKAGMDIFPPPADGTLTADEARGMVESSTVGLSADPSLPGPDTFRTKTGRFELYDDRAVFYAVRGGDIVRTSQTVSPTATALAGPQVEAVVLQAQTASGNTMNAAQLAALRTLLTAPGQTHVTTLTLPTAVRSASQINGSVFIQFPNSSVMIAPQGQVTVMSAGGSGAAAGFSRASIPINGAAMAVAVMTTLALAGLSIYLFVIGILIFRGSPYGRRLHQVYAWLKIPLTAISVLSVWWLTSSFAAAAMNAGNGMPAVPFFSNMMSTVILIPQIVGGLVGCIYPVALLITLQTVTVKDYYRMAGG